MFHGKVDGFGGFCVESHIVTLASGAAEIATKLRSIRGVSITQVGAAAASEGFSLNEQVVHEAIASPSGKSLTIDSSNGSSTATVCVMLIGN